MTRMKKLLILFKKYFSSKKSRIIFIPIFGLVCLVFILLGLVKYSTMPSFCARCHIMKPYYDAWAGSKHKSVKCVECHYPPGEKKLILWKKFQALSQVVKYVTRTYSSKPYAEIEDASCLREGCHSERLLSGKIIHDGKIFFDHRPHLLEKRRGRQLRCTACHSQIVVGKHIEVTWDTCYLCHFRGYATGRDIKPVGGCLGCHKLPEKNFVVQNISYNHRDFVDKYHIDCTNCHVDLVSGDGSVNSDRCMTCHNEEEKLAKYSDIPFIHENHLEKRNVACFHCHSEMKHNVATQGQKELNYDCYLCHQDKHIAQKNLYRGIGVKSIDMKPMPSPMYLANVDCVACHIAKKKGLEFAEIDFEGSTTGCEKCHPASYTKTTNDAKSLINKTLRSVKEKLSFIEKSSNGVSELGNIKHDLSMIEKGHGVHNVYFSSQVLRSMNNLIDKIAKTKSLLIPDLSDNPLISGSFCATMCHEKIGIKVPAREVKYKGKKMPHQMHWKDAAISCFNCHEFLEHKNVKLKIDTKFCKNCHEGGM